MTKTSENKESHLVVGDINEIKNFYETVYYAKRSDNLHVARHYFRLFNKLGLKPKQKILDVACGSGEWLKVCEISGLDVNGVDLSERAIEICELNMPAGNFFSQSAEKLPFEDGSFDVVTCLGSLEHFVDPVKSLQEMVRTSKSDAVFVILVPNKGFLTRRLGLFGGTQQVDAKEEVRFLDEWNELFETAGLKVAKRWKDLHVLNWQWIRKGKPIYWPIRALQGLLLLVWPLSWQYQVYHLCEKK